MTYTITLSLSEKVFFFVNNKLVSCLSIRNKQKAAKPSSTVSHAEIEKLYDTEQVVVFIASAGEKCVQHDSQGRSEEVHQLSGCCWKWQRSCRFDSHSFSCGV